jgi:hypothetical protein
MLQTYRCKLWNISPIAGVICVLCLCAAQLQAESLTFTDLFRGYHYIALLNDLFSSPTKEKENEKCFFANDSTFTEELILTHQ